MGKYEYFTDEEVKGLQDTTCQKLSIARGIAQSPFIITSGLRTTSQNESLTESVKDSSHLTGNGVDLSCPDSSMRFAMLKGLIGAGFTRIGIYSMHLHADDSPTLRPNVCWYSSGT
jgi:Peptidase M15